MYPSSSRNLFPVLSGYHELWGNGALILELNLLNGARPLTKNESLDCGRNFIDIIVNISFNLDDFIMEIDRLYFHGFIRWKVDAKFNGNLNIIYTRNGQFYSGVPILIATHRNPREKQTRVHRKVFWEYVNPTGDYL